MKEYAKEHSNLEKGAKGMPYFEKDHWEKKMDGTSTAGGRYSSEMNQKAEYGHSVDKLAAYVKSHRAEH